MTPFERLKSIAAPLPVANIDTDKILPARFLKTISRSGLGTALFHALRDDPDFVLLRAPWSAARILVTGHNFGCGSSREHAPWALLDFGIRCIIAPSFADIFHNNCFKNGILPVTLPDEQIDRLTLLASDPAKAMFEIDLVSQFIFAHRTEYRFEIDASRKAMLLDGVDEIARTLDVRNRIDAFEADEWSRHDMPIDLARFDRDGAILPVRSDSGLLAGRQRDAVVRSKVGA